ncbi:phage tail protein [Qipengyuania nanhaisediminis]|uniref:phage tail protein n=1 Tax=Qipengyuania nanhaisediminis TaxID=604088 RepID=UPI0038B2B2BE
MATLVFTAVGTALGGPLGGAVGALIGRQADRAIFGTGSREGPRLKELSVTSSSYGQPIARHFGRMRVAGTVIWSTELTETTKKEGGGKGKPSTKTYSYSASFAVALSSTPLDRVGRIWADGNLLRGAGGDLKVAGAMRVYTGTGDAEVDPLIEADRGGVAPAFRDCAYVVFENLELGDFGNRIPALTFEIFAARDQSVSIKDLVPQTASSATDILLEHARGFSDEGGSVGASLSAIRRVYPLGCVSGPDGLRFEDENFPSGTVPTLPERLSDEEGGQPDALPSRRGGTLGSEPMALRYYDEQRDYQPGVQRALGRRPEGRENMLDLPAAMTAGGARELANANAHRARWLNETVSWKVAEIDPAIGPGTIVRVPERPGYWRVQSWEWFDRGVEIGLQRIGPPPGAAATGDSGTLNDPRDLPVTETMLKAFEIPASDATNPAEPIMFAAGTSPGAGWRGASLFVDQGGTLANVGAMNSRRAVSGELAFDLGPSNCTIIEAGEAMEVDLPAQDLSFASTDMTGLAMGENRLLVGGEIIQFLEAEAINAYRWRLSGLLRGRAGTEDLAAAGHAAGTGVVLIDDRLTSLSPEDVPSLAGTRIAAIGQGDDEPVYSDLAHPGLSRRPPMPVAAVTHERDNGNWELCWTRRARGQWRWRDSSETPLVEETEKYTVGYGSTDSPYAAWTTSESLFVISQQERDDLIAQFGAGDLWVRQVGTYGPSPALLLTTLT